MNSSVDCEYVDAGLAEYRFNSFNSEADTYLKDNGFCVIKNVLNQNELIHSYKLLWDFLETLGWNKRYPNSWIFDKNKGHSDTGIFWGHGVGHSKLQWFIRTNKNVLDTFAKIWNITTNELISSFDGIGIFRPWYLNKLWKTSSSWYHIDQNPKNKPNRVTIQGYVTLHDQNEKTGTMELIPQSHLYTINPNYLNISHNSDYVSIPKNNKLLNMKHILLCCKAGDLVLWDSRNIHCNSPSILSLNEMKQIYLNDNKSKHRSLNLLNELISILDQNKNDKIYNFLRTVVYVCMTPKCNANENILISRVKAYIYRYNLNHYPHEFAILNVPKLNKYPDYLKKQSIDDLSGIKKSLIGMDDNIFRKVTFLS